MDAPSKRPDAARGPGGQDVRKAQRWGVFLLVSFSFDKERKVTRPLCGRNALLQKRKSQEEAGLSRCSRRQE
jgi:hypothetical protein